MSVGHLGHISTGELTSSRIDKVTENKAANVRTDSKGIQVYVLAGIVVRGGTSENGDANHGKSGQ